MDPRFGNRLFPVPISRWEKCRGLGLPHIGLGLFLLASSVGAQGGDESLPVLENLVGEWSRLRVAIADEERSWTLQEKQLNAEIALLQLEIRDLKSEIADTAEEEASTRNTRNSLRADHEKFIGTFDGLPALLREAETALRRWPDRIPAPLRAPLDAAFQRLPETPEEGGALAQGARLQTIVALYSEIEKIQRDVHFVKQIVVRPDGIRQEMDVCYLGLARAFAVSPDDTWAAIGTPSENGWVWASRPESAETIRRAVSIYNRERAAELVALPLQVMEPGE